MRKSMSTLLLLGDSLIEYGDWQRLLPEYIVSNRGIAGETAGELAGRLAGEVDLETDPDLVFILSGTNDLLMGDTFFSAVFTTMLPLLRHLCPDAVITVIGLAPVTVPGISRELLARVNSSLAETAENAGCGYLDLLPVFDLYCRPVGNPCFLADGVHFTPHGYGVLAGAIRKHLLSPHEDDS
jgi:lysophospholipase L1-like esterase